MIPVVPARETVRRILYEQGRTQTGVVKRMNELNSQISMDTSKFNCIITGKRKMSGDELLTFCMAVGISPEEFLKPK